MLEGYASEGFESVLEAFKHGFSQGVDKGASFAVYYKGSLVTKAFGGLIEEKPKRLWAEDTLGFFYSGSKFLSSLVIARLVEKHLLSYEEKISTHWDEFGCNGKEEMTLRQLLSHTSGLSIIDEDYKLEWMRERPDLLIKLLEKQSPLWTPGKETGYSQVLGGLYLNEIVKRVDPKGRTISQYFHEDIAVPFGLDIYIGLPNTLHYKTPRLNCPQYSKEELQNKMAEFAGNIDLYKKSISQPSDWNSRWKMHDPDFSSLPSPSSHAVAKTMSMAKLASIISTGGHYQGKTLLTQGMIDRLQKPVAHGKDYLAGSNWTYGLGTMLIPVRQGDKTWFLFGHTGLGGQVILVDSLNHIGLAYNTNYMNPFTSFDSNRWKHLVEALYSCIQRREGSSENVRLFGTYQEFFNDLQINPVKSKL